MLIAPDITDSTTEERRAFIKAKYPCIADCDMCGLCKVFRGKNAEQAYDDYITGKRSFMDVSADYRRTSPEVEADPAAALFLPAALLVLKEVTLTV